MTAARPCAERRADAGREEAAVEGCAGGPSGGASTPPETMRQDRRSAQSGQALVESSILIATVLGVLGVGGWYLMHTQPDMMNALSTYVRGVYYMLSLPIP
jgi:hypothetical protein